VRRPETKKYRSQRGQALRIKRKTHSSTGSAARKKSVGNNGGQTTAITPKASAGDAKAAAIAK